MAIPDYQSLMKPILLLFKDGNEHKTSEVVEQIAEEFKLTDEERNKKLPSGKTRTIKNRVEWAITYLTKAALLSKVQRGYRVITDRGKGLLDKNPDRINNRFLLQYPEYVKFKYPNREEEEVPPETQNELQLTPEEQLSKSYREINSSLKSELLDLILSQTPEFFEELVVKLLQAMGYGDGQGLARAVGGTGDGGIDGIIHQDKLGLDAVYIQAKRYGRANSVGSEALRAFVGSLSGASATKGVFVTTSSFSSPAKEYLNTIEKRVVLIDGDRLVELMIQHGVGVRIEKTFSAYRIDEDFFID